MLVGLSMEGTESLSSKCGITITEKCG